jgi:hypothetical protein
MKGGDFLATTKQEIKVQEMALQSSFYPLDLTNVAAVTPL